MARAPVRTLLFSVGIFSNIKLDHVLTINRELGANATHVEIGGFDEKLFYISRYIVRYTGGTGFAQKAYERLCRDSTTQ